MSDKVLEGELIQEGNPINTGQTFNIGDLIKPGDIEKGKTTLTPEQMEQLKQQMSKGNS